MSFTAKKYFTTYKNSLSQFFQYRLNLGLLVVSHVVSLSGLIYLWIAVYAAGQTVGTYSLEHILVYYIVLTILHITISEGVGMGFEVSDHIKDGVVTNYLVKPFSYSIERLVKMLWQVTINVFFIIPVIAVLLIIKPDSIPSPSILQWMQFAGMAFIGLLFYFLLYYAAALSSFWLHQGRAMVFALLLTSNLLNGSLLPLDMFPDWFQKLSRVLPFTYLIFLPIQTLLGRIEGWGFLLLVACLWALGLSLFIFLIWKRGIRRFEAGGR